MQAIKEGIRIYHYYYHEIKTPIKIEARTKQQARVMLDNLFDRLPNDYKNSKIVGESVIIPLKGISEKTIKGVKYIWVGEDKTSNGWMEERQYLRAISKK